MPIRTWVAGETPTAAMFNDFLQKQVVITCTSGTRPGSPVEGMVIYETDTDKVLTYTGTVWDLPKNRAGGTLGYAEVTANQTGIGTTATDLTGLSVAVTVGTARRIKVTGHVLTQQNTSAGIVIGYVREGSTILGRFGTSNVAASGNELLDGAVVVNSPTAGTHTYKLSLNTNVSTADLLATADYKAFILIEDIGGV